MIEKLTLFLVPDKKGAKEELTKMRSTLIEKIKGKNNFEILYIPFPERKKGIHYKEKVKEWRLTKAKILKNVLMALDKEEAGFLIWGDPAIYDGHIEILKEIEKDLPIEWELIPGISAFQVLSAKCKISLTELATPLTFHTPRTLRKLNSIDHPTVVFLDNYETYKKFLSDKRPLKIYWGAYVGTPKEIFIEGKLERVSDKISILRKEFKEKNGYLMEIYFLKADEEENL